MPRLIPPQQNGQSSSTSLPPKPPSLRLSPETVNDADDLAPLAIRGKAEYEEGKAATREGILHFHTFGKILIEAKARCPAKKWGQWIEDNFKFTIRTADRYMELARLDVATSNLEDEWRRIQNNPPRKKRESPKPERKRKGDDPPDLVDIPARLPEAQAQETLDWVEELKPRLNLAPSASPAEGTGQVIREALRRWVEEVRRG